MVNGREERTPSKRLRNARKAVARRKGRMLSLRETAAVLRLDEEAVMSDAGQRRLLSISVDRRTVFPACRFMDGGPLPGLSLMIDTFAKHKPWSVLDFLTDLETAVSGPTPAEALADGNLEADGRMLRAYRDGEGFS